MKLVEKVRGHLVNVLKRLDPEDENRYTARTSKAQNWRGHTLRSRLISLSPFF